MRNLFSPVRKSFIRIKIQTHYKEECQIFELIDETSIAM